MNFRWSVTFPGIVLFALAPIAHANSISIPIVNFSFEDAGAGVPLAPDTHNGFSDDGAQYIPGWVSAGGWNGIHNPTGAGQFSSNEAPDGSDVVFDDGGAVSQVLTTDLSLGTYDLTVAIGHRDTAPFGGGEIELFAGGTLLKSVSMTDPGSGNFQDESLTYTALAGNANLGQALEISLVGNGGGFNQIPAGIDDFDNVRLDFVAAPEPSTWMMVVTGGTVLAAGLRRALRTGGSV